MFLRKAIQSLIVVLVAVPAAQAGVVETIQRAVADVALRQGAKIGLADRGEALDLDRADDRPQPLLEIGKRGGHRGQQRGAEAAPCHPPVLEHVAHG